MAFLDGNGVLYLWQKILLNFVKKDGSKVLSTNDYTTEEKTKLSGISEGANKTTVEDVLTSTSGVNALSAKQGKVLDEKIKAINDGLGELGGGDMLKSAYDIDDNGQVDKADDADKFGGQLPSYYAKAADLNGYVPTSAKGQANGVASLGADGKVPESQLPETAPVEHTHEMSDINGLAEGVQQMTNTINGKASTADLEAAVEEMTEIANGKCDSYVFDTVADLDTWLANTENTAKLKTGDVFYIRAVDVPDYWWDESTKSKQVLETTKVDLSTISNAEIDAIVAS